MATTTTVARKRADLRDPRSFDHVGRDVDARGFVAGEVLAELADTDPRIVCGAADLKYVTQMAVFEARHPQRFFQFGIAERNMISAAAGLATMGLRPYVSTFACFSGILAFENIRTDAAYPRLPVRILATHAGIAMGYFGTSHHATEDIAALRAVADLMILSPSDAASTAALLRATVDHPGPIYFRLGRGREDDIYTGQPTTPAAPGGPGAPSVLRKGTDVLVVATGAVVGPTLAAVDHLASEGVSATLLDAHTLKPFSDTAVAEHASGHAAVVTVEEHNVLGGLGTIVTEALSSHRVNVPVYRHGLQDEYSLIGPPSHLYRYYGLDSSGIASAIRRAASQDVDPRRRLWTADDARAVLASVEESERR